MGRFFSLKNASVHYGQVEKNELKTNWMSS